MTFTLDEGFEVIVSTVEPASILIEGVDSVLDLSKKGARPLVEIVVLISAFLSAQFVENL